MSFFSVKRTLSLWWFCACLPAAWATDESYVNLGPVTDPAPVIDAFNFLNLGSFDIHTSLPYDTSNTLNYTNRGTMKGTPGYRFDTVKTSGRVRAVNFVNEGSIESGDNGTIFFIGQSASSFGSYLLVNATNITSPGLLSASSSGIVKLQGNNIDLRNSPVLAADSATEQSFGFLDPYTATNFFPQSRINDLYWGIGTNGVFSGEGNPLDLAFQFTDSFVFSGEHTTIDLYNFTNDFTDLFLFGFKAFAFTNRVSPSNQVIQVVFVSTNFADTNTTVDVRFVSNGQAARGRQEVVQFSLPDTDPVTGLPFTNYVYFSDNSAAATYNTNLFYQDNRGATTLRPNCYSVTLGTPSQWNNGATSNVPFTASLLYDPNYVNSVVTNVYAGYGVSIGNTINYSSIGNFGFTNQTASSDPSNSVGRIEIYADKKLDVNGARLRSEGLLTIKATNLVDLNVGARLDALQTSLDITSTNKTFLLTNLLANSVRRLTGNLFAWSGVWSNQTVNGDDNRFQVLILDNQMAGAQSSVAYNFALHVTNQPNTQVILADPVIVGRTFLVEAQSLTIKSNLSLPSSLGSTNLPRTLYLTNEGSMDLSSGYAFFTLPTGPYSSFVNRGSIVAFSESIHSLQVENSGLIYASAGVLSVSNRAGTAIINGGRFIAASDLIFETQDFRSSNAVFSAGSVTTNFSGGTVFTPGTIFLSVGNSLTNLGTSNIWQCVNGFQLTKTLPGGWTGDLLGTKIQSTSRPFNLTRHVWTGANRGASPSGYVNNAAVGWLTLDGGTTGRFRFDPSTTTDTAMYVDYLELKGNATNYFSALEFATNFTLYFANANLPVSKLDGAITNHLRWVSSFAGPNSSTNVALRTGGFVTVNIVLAQSTTIDSDADGTPNAFDVFPFDGPTTSAAVVRQGTNNVVTLSWNGAANTAYTVENTTNLVSWQVLTSVTTGASVGPVSIQDTVPLGTRRFYRVRYTP